MKFSGVTILQGVEFSIFHIDFEWALQQCSATALPVIFCQNSPGHLPFPHGLGTKNRFLSRDFVAQLYRATKLQYATACRTLQFMSQNTI